MGKTYGYCRISKKKQSIERQERNIRAFYPDAIIVKEAFTGTKIDGRKEWDKVVKAVKPGDTIVFDSVSRMSRNAEDGFEQYQMLFSRGIALVFLKEPHINTETYKNALNNQIAMTGSMVDSILAGVNEYLMELAKEQIRLAFEQAAKEVEDLHQRTKEGIETARLSGKQIGQQKGRKLIIKKEAPAKAAIREHSKSFGGTLDDDECIKVAGVSRNTFYKYKKQIRQEQQEQG